MTDNTDKNDLIDILDSNPAVEDYSVKDAGVRFWIGVRAYEGAKQAVIDDIESLEDVGLRHEKTENDWEWYYASLPQEQ